MPCFIKGAYSSSIAFFQTSCLTASENDLGSVGPGTTVKDKGILGLEMPNLDLVSIGCVGTGTGIGIDGPKTFDRTDETLELRETEVGKGGLEEQVRGTTTSIGIAGIETLRESKTTRGIEDNLRNVEGENISGEDKQENMEEKGNSVSINLTCLEI